ncbi:gastrin-releasing peptide receptor-like [Saccostrea echinata]|uniref:gastrin-releasing peptide receptor-like n=1 Tax=Saccostrea echinata TaxID=191078 RepID=UPI002A81D2AF|nr:gastrin-releasing peptide receptor-like [Saccostrea echinata]
MNVTTQITTLFNVTSSMCMMTSPSVNNSNNNSCVDNITTDCGPSHNSFTEYDEYIAALFINKNYLYFIVGLGIPGNIAAIITVCKMKPFTSSSVFMIALATMDSFNLIIKELYYQLTYYDIQMYDIGCQLMIFLGTFAMQYANWILVAMTAERFIAIKFPMKVQEICTKTKVIIVLVVLGLVLASLNSHFFATKREGYTALRKYSCMSKVGYDNFYTKIWYWIDGVVYAMAPFCLLTILNFLIIAGIRDSVKKQKDLTNLQQKQSKQHTQITVMLVTVSVVFTVLTMPNCIFFIYDGYWDFEKSCYETALYHLIYQVVFVLSDLNHAVNFYFYFLSGKKFRKHFLKLICCSKRKFHGTTATTITRSSRYHMSVTSTPSSHSLVDHDATCNPSTKISNRW